MTQTYFRVRYEIRGGHVHMRVFAGKGSMSLGLCGTLVMRVEEFEDFRHDTMFFEFLPENQSE